MTIQDQNGNVIIRYDNAGTTKAERKAIFQANLAKAERDAKAGNVLCLSDLICQAEQLHIDNAQ